MPWVVMGRLIGTIASINRQQLQLPNYFKPPQKLPMGNPRILDLILCRGIGIHAVILQGCNRSHGSFEVTRKETPNRTEHPTSHCTGCVPYRCRPAGWAGSAGDGGLDQALLVVPLRAISCLASCSSSGVMSGGSVAALSSAAAGDGDGGVGLWGSTIRRSGPCG